MKQHRALPSSLGEANAGPLWRCPLEIGSRPLNWPRVVKRRSKDRFEQKGDPFKMKGELRGAESSRTLRADAVLLHLAPERDGADLQGVGRLTPIAAKTLERALDHGPFLRLKIEAVVSGTQACLVGDFRR